MLRPVRRRCGEAAAKVRASQPLRAACALALRADLARPSRVCVCVCVCVCEKESVCVCAALPLHALIARPVQWVRLRPAARGMFRACGVRGACGMCGGVLCERLARMLVVRPEGPKRRSSGPHLHAPCPCSWVATRATTGVMAAWQGATAGRPRLLAALEQSCCTLSGTRMPQSRRDLAPLLPAASCPRSWTHSSLDERRCERDAILTGQPGRTGGLRRRAHGTQELDGGGLGCARAAPRALKRTRGPPRTVVCGGEAAGEALFAIYAHPADPDARAAAERLQQALSSSAARGRSEGRQGEGLTLPRVRHLFWRRGTCGATGGGGVWRQGPEERAPQGAPRPLLAQRFWPQRGARVLRGWLVAMTAARRGLPRPVARLLPNYRTCVAERGRCSAAARRAAQGDGQAR